MPASRLLCCARSSARGVAHPASVAAVCRSMPPLPRASSLSLDSHPLFGMFGVGQAVSFTVGTPVLAEQFVVEGVATELAWEIDSGR
jgi:hypothetical protein